MSEPYTIGSIRFSRVDSRSVRIVKAAERPAKTAEQYQREHEIALLKLLAPKYPHIVRELVDVLVK